MRTECWLVPEPSNPLHLSCKDDSITYKAHESLHAMRLELMQHLDADYPGIDDK